MIYKWACEECGWEGDEPIQAYEESKDGGYPACPNGCCWEKDGEPVGVVLNPNHADNMLMFAKTLSKAYR